MKQCRVVLFGLPSGFGIVASTVRASITDCKNVLKTKGSYAFLGFSGGFSKCHLRQVVLVVWMVSLGDVEV